MVDAGFHPVAEALDGATEGDDAHNRAAWLLVLPFAARTVLRAEPTDAGVCSAGLVLPAVLPKGNAQDSTGCHERAEEDLLTWTGQHQCRKTHDP